MITLEAPHMGLNDPRHAFLKVQMWNTWNVTQTETVDHMLNWVAAVARGAAGGKLKNVVFCCHGAPAFVQCGAGITRSDTSKFSAWRGLVEKIWFRACLVGYITPGTGGAPGPASGDGNLFCSEIAKAAQCYIVTPTETQTGTVNRILPYGKLDTYEGLVLSYGPEGNVTWSHRYPSAYKYSDGNWYQNPD
jgi:hypothetical protein